MTFDLAFLKKRLAEATEPSRELDGDVWWIVALDDDSRDMYDRPIGGEGYIRSVMVREGSPGKGLAKFYDSAARPPSKLDYAPNYTKSLDEVLWLVDRKVYRHQWPDVLRRAISAMAHEGAWHITFPKEDDHRRLPLAVLRVLVDDLLVVEEARVEEF